jgi:hypothetical protein
LTIPRTFLFTLHPLEQALCRDMRDIVGGLDLEEEEIAVEQSHEAVVAGEEVKEELCLSESDNFSLLRAHYSVMKWITLKSNNLPIVALEIERAIEVFTSIRVPS